MALVALSTPIGLLITEGTLRALRLEPARRPRMLSPSCVRAVEGPMEYEYIPGRTQGWVYPQSAYGPERRVEARINSHGHRGRERSVEKTGGAMRVVCVGDSFTFGTGVGDDETWPAQLQHFFDETLGAEAVEVWNCGIEGIDTDQEVAHLEHRLLAFAPDLVLIGFYANDAGDGRARFEPLSPAGRSVMSLCREDARGFARWIRSRSWLAEWLAQSITRRLLWTRPSQIQAACFEEGRPGWEMVKRELVRARDLCSARGVQLAVVLYPTLVRAGEHLTTHQPYATVAAFCDARELRCIDLEPALEKLPPERLWVHPLDAHPSAEANAAAGRAIGAALMQMQLVRAR